MTGGAVYDYVKDFTTGQGYVTTDGANIDVDGSNSKWLSKLGTQAGTAAVSDANNHFVTGKDVYEATHVTNDGNYVNRLRPILRRSTMGSARRSARTTSPVCWPSRTASM